MADSKEGITECNPSDGGSIIPGSKVNHLSTNTPTLGYDASPSKDHTHQSSDNHTHQSSDNHTQSTPDQRTALSINHLSNSITSSELGAGLRAQDSESNIERSNTIPSSIHTRVAVQEEDVALTRGSLLSSKKESLLSVSTSLPADTSSHTRRNFSRTRSQRSKRAKKIVDETSPFTSDLSGVDSDGDDIDDDDDSERTLSSYSDHNTFNIMTRRVTRSSQRRFGLSVGGVKKGGRMKVEGTGGDRERVVVRPRGTRYRKPAEKVHDSASRKLGLSSRRRSRMTRLRRTLDSNQTSGSSNSDSDRLLRNTRKGRDYQSNAPKIQPCDQEYLPPSKSKKGHSAISYSPAPSSPPTRGNILAEILTDIPEVSIQPHSMTPSSKTSSNSQLLKSTSLSSPSPTKRSQSQSQSQFQSPTQASRIRHTHQSNSRSPRDHSRKGSTRRKARSRKSPLPNSSSQREEASLADSEYGDQYDDYDDDGSIIDGDGASEMMMDDGVSVHHKVLKSWETDYIRGYKATRGPILYVMENFPDKLNFQAPWMTKAKLVWTIWRHRVSDQERRLYTEKAKQNRLALFGSIKGNKMEIPIRGRKNSVKRTRANKEVPLIKCEQEDITMQHCSPNTDIPSPCQQPNSPEATKAKTDCTIPSSVSSTINDQISCSITSTSKLKSFATLQSRSQKSKSGKAATSPQNQEERRGLLKSKSLPPISDMNMEMNVGKEVTVSTFSDTPSPSVSSATSLSTRSKILRSTSLPAENVIAGTCKRLPSVELPGDSCKRQNTSREHDYSKSSSNSSSPHRYLVQPPVDNSWFLSLSTQINSFCTSTSLSIAPLSPRKTSVSSSCGIITSVSSQQPRKVHADNQTGNSSLATEFVIPKSRDKNQIHSSKLSSKPLVSKAHAKRTNPDPRRSRGSIKKERSSQNVSPLTSSHMTADRQSFISPRVSRHRINSLQSSFLGGDGVTQCNTSNPNVVVSGGSSVMQCNTSITNVHNLKPDANNASSNVRLVESLHSLSCINSRLSGKPRSTSTSSSALSSPCSPDMSDDALPRKRLNSTVHHTGTSHTGSRTSTGSTGTPIFTGWTGGPTDHVSPSIGTPINNVTTSAEPIGSTAARIVSTAISTNGHIGQVGSTGIPIGLVASDVLTNSHVAVASTIAQICSTSMPSGSVPGSITFKSTPDKRTVFSKSIKTNFYKSLLEASICQQKKISSSLAAGTTPTLIPPQTSSGGTASVGSSSLQPKLFMNFNEMSVQKGTVPSPVHFRDGDNSRAKKKFSIPLTPSSRDSDNVFSPTSSSKLSTPMIVDPPNIYLNEATEIKLATVRNSNRHIQSTKASKPNKLSDFSVRNISTSGSDQSVTNSNSPTVKMDSPTIKKESLGQDPSRNTSRAPEMELSRMSHWEVEQLYHYSLAILEQQKHLIKLIEKRLEESKQSETDGQKKSNREAYKKLLKYTVEPDVMPEEVVDKFGFTKPKTKLNDLTIGGTAQRPIINKKYDIYAKFGKRHS